MYGPREFWDGGFVMGTRDLLRRRAEECVKKADESHDREQVRRLLVKAHTFLQSAEELEAEELNARS
jgi:hypothetical protein